MKQKKHPSAGLFAAIAALLVTTSYDAYCGHGVPECVRQLRTELKPETGQTSITAEELIKKLKNSGARGAVFYDGDIIFTDEGYYKNSRYSDLNTIVFMRITDEKTRETITRTLGRGRGMRDGAKYFSL